MKKLLGVEQSGGCTTRYWQHFGDDGRKKITVETVEDGEVAIRRAKNYSQNRGGDIRYVASIPVTMVDKISRIKAAEWGMTTRDAFAEIVSSRTDRAKGVWRTLTTGRDHAKLQAKTYQ